jgi:probable HAF family extracellular repeat protein
MQDLGTLGGTFSEGFAINNRGQVTGDAVTASGPEHAFRWTPLTSSWCRARCSRSSLEMVTGTIRCPRESVAKGGYKR